MYNLCYYPGLMNASVFKRAIVPSLSLLCLACPLPLVSLSQQLLEFISWEAEVPGTEVATTRISAAGRACPLG